MVYFEIALLGVALALDACCVSMSNGLNDKVLKIQKALLFGLVFGFFQALMPLIGYGIGELSGVMLHSIIQNVDHFIAFGLLAIVGGKMIYDGFKQEDCGEETKMTFWLLIVQGIATSIDALAVGFSIKTMDGANIWLSILIIGLITLALASLAYIIGNKFGNILSNKSTIIGGLILLAIGSKILIEHLIKGI